MKKVIIKNTKKLVMKKESEFEMLARIVSGGFNSMDKRFEKLEDEMNERFDNVDKRFDGIDKRFESVDAQISSLHSEQRETNKRLDSIEKKQCGVLASVDEAIHRSEFKSLVYRVGILEKRVPKK